MNRQQRRKQKKSNIPQPRKKSKSEIFSLEMMTVAFLWVLYDKAGYGKTRLERVYENVKELFDSYLDRNQITLIDLKNALEDECGVIVDFTYNDDENRRVL